MGDSAADNGAFFGAEIALPTATAGQAMYDLAEALYPICRSITGDGVRDTGCSLKAMRRDCREALVPFKGMHRFIPALIKGAGHSVVEVPVNHRPRQHGDSKYGGGLGRALPATEDMFGVKWLLSRRFEIRFRD